MRRCLLAAVSVVGVLVLPVAAMLARPADAARADDPAPVTISMNNIAFIPAETTVPVGTTVTWSDDEPDVPHSATSTDGLWDSGLLNTGDTFSYQFTAAGDYLYYCLIHYQMHAVIHVVAADADAGGQ